MTLNYPPLTVKVEGELACFTRPEMKVERVSYPVMTPTAAKGIPGSDLLEAGIYLAGRGDTGAQTHPVRVSRPQRNRLAPDRPDGATLAAGWWRL